MGVRLNRRTFLKSPIAASPTSTRLNGLLQQQDGYQRNILILTCDDLRPELNCYGKSHIHSPNIDELASQGVLFKRAYCQAPTCGPSRASIISGLRIDDSAAMHNHGWSAEGMNFDFTSLPKYFGKHGYHTVSLGKVMHKIGDLADDWSEPPGGRKKCIREREIGPGTTTSIFGKILPLRIK